MQKSISATEGLSATNEDSFDPHIPQYCVRHITSIQIRNLTPFPVRDTIASALTQRSTVASSHTGVSSDDADILLSRRRSRKTSSASLNTLRSLHSDRGHGHDVSAAPDSTPVGSRVRVRTSSRASFHGQSITATPIAKRQPHTISSGTSPTSRRTRPRTHSQSSVLESFLSLGASHSAQSTSTAGSSLLFDAPSSQRQLENIIWSRLVETFLTISVPADEISAHPPQPPTPPTFSPQKGTAANGTQPKLRQGRSHESRRVAVPSSASSIRQRPQATSHSSPVKIRSGAVSPSPSTNGSHSGPISSPASLRKITFPHSPPPTPPPSAGSDENPPPIYMSPFHPPSTNPKFVLDNNGQEFAPWADLSMNKVIVQLWGRVGKEWGLVDKKGKGKEKEPSSNNIEDGDWKVLNTWEVNLNDLMPFSEDISLHPWKIPANTLLLTLAPFGRTYYLPSVVIGMSPAHSRSHSPEYNSDPENTVLRPRRRADQSSPLATDRGRQRKSRRVLKSTGWNELVKLVSLQSAVYDAQNVLEGIVRSCNQLIDGDKGSVLRREASEREYRLQTLQERRDALEDAIKSVRDDTEARRLDFQQRRVQLAEARALHEKDLITEFNAGATLAEERNRVKTLTNHIEPIRTSLLSALAFIFPIDLISPPDLLFSILSIALPIPLNGTDPAPPLSLPSYNDVNEDTVSTALGYAAFLVQLMSRYLCRRLLYPITYIGSKSLIKDPISAMMGPRMFPLYSRGVDTYRFEYAVFLLNKDIELLMTDRNLRAMDLRHTLPNLKNLLLTLTSGESALPRSRPLPSPSISSGLQSPDRVSSPPPLALGASSSPSTTPKLTSSSLPSSESEDTTGNGTSDSSLAASPMTPSTSSSASGVPNESSASRKGRSYLGFMPLSSMFRVRYPSSGGKVAGKIGDDASDQSIESEMNASDSAEASVDGDIALDDDEDDRRTIRAEPTAADESGPDDKIGNGHLENDEKQRESEGTAAAVVESVIANVS